MSIVERTKIKTYKLSEIATWMQLDSNVQLPVIQRGFVWKPNQIEDLWDSIFKGYPIGSLMLSQEATEDEEIKYMLLDGQQRATSIAIGFNDPWGNNNRSEIGNAKNLPVVWVDIAEEEKNDGTKSNNYTFRVVTRSHPWGYQLKDNSQKLSVADRNKAFDQIKPKLDGDNKYTRLAAKHRFPYDSKLPIPLSFLIKATNTEDLKDLLQKNGIMELQSKWMINNSSDYEKEIEKNKSILQCAIDEIKALLVNENTQVEIPVLILPKSVLQNQTEEIGSEESTLFVRLNRSGTRLDGEELIYSMYKSIYKESENIVKCAPSFIAPSKTISLLSRLVLSSINNNQYTNKISFKQFNRLLKNEKFTKGLEEKGENIGDLIKIAIDILSYKQVPCIIVKKFIREASDGFLLLLHWLENNKQEITESLKAQICGCLYRTYWLGNIEKFTRKYWKEVVEASWDWQSKHEHQHPLLSPNLLRSCLLGKMFEITLLKDKLQQDNTISAAKNEIQNIDEDVRNDVYLNRLCWNKSLILLAQRDYIEKCFGDFNQFDNLDDTNTPWDWDHIYPNSWVYRKEGINGVTRYFEQIIGNFRAMELSENRSENNHLPPQERIQDKDNRKNYFIHDDWQYWEKLNKESKTLHTDVEGIYNHAMAIITRTVNIYSNFLEMFSLSPDKYPNRIENEQSDNN